MCYRRRQAGGVGDARGNRTPHGGRVVEYDRQEKYCHEVSAIPAKESLKNPYQGSGVDGK